MLSAPNYDFVIPPLQCLQQKAAVASAVINKAKENDGIYIPTNLEKDSLPMFHINNIDWLEDTPGENSTSHYLKMNIFWRKIKS